MENPKPSNPYAFPCEKDEPDKGMTLRDYFAAKAMQALLSTDSQMAKLNGGTIQENDKIVSVTSYRIADAMLKQREL